MDQDIADKEFLKAIEALLKRALPLLGREPEVFSEVLWGFVMVLDRAIAASRPEGDPTIPENGRPLRIARTA
jgi:hypothetical protein